MPAFLPQRHRGIVIFVNEYCNFPRILSLEEGLIDAKTTVKTYCPNMTSISPFELAYIFHDIIRLKANVFISFLSLPNTLFLLEVAKTFHLTSPRYTWVFNMLAVEKHIKNLLPSAQFIYLKDTATTLNTMQKAVNIDTLATR